MIPDPLTLDLADPDDRDFEALHDEAVRWLAARSPRAWSDHNLSDPGITLLDAMCTSVADLHYRIAGNDFADAPIRSRNDLVLGGGVFGEELPASATPAVILRVAEVLADPSTLRNARAAIAAANSRGEALVRLSSDLGESSDVAVAMAAVLRAPLVRRHTLDHTDLVATVHDASDGEPAATLAALRDEPALAELWTEELGGLIARETHLRVLDAFVTVEERLGGAATPAGRNTLIADLQAPPFALTQSASEALADMHPRPPERRPEDFEEADGASVAWPPHPLQARVVEPVVADDYAGRARSVDGVHRAWVVPGRVNQGIAWDGTPMDELPQAHPARDPDDSAVLTLVVEGDRERGESEEDFLRRVLGEALSGQGEVSEVARPYRHHHQEHATGLDRQAPRRVLGDEVAACSLAASELTISATLHVAAGADERGAVLERARARVTALFEAGRPESAPPTSSEQTGPGSIAGAWPTKPQPTKGWVPGDPVRLGELTAALADDPVVLGVEGLSVGVNDGPTYPTPTSQPPLQVELDQWSVPRLGQDCLEVKFDLDGGCD